MFKGLFAAIFLLTPILNIAQTNKNVIVEHFTNTRCSICANRNPGFYGNLNNHEDIIHIAFHPSAPYNNCILNLHNVQGNDNRTNYYGVYGSTPKLAIQGVNINSSANYSSPSIFAPYLGQSSPLSISFDSLKMITDSIAVQVTIEVEDTHSYVNLSLYIALAEDTVFYMAPNGENLHFDVFRRAFTPYNGAIINIPANPGQSVKYKSKIKIHPEWDLKRVYPICILQETFSRKVVQSKKGSYPELVPDLVVYPADGELNFPNIIHNNLVINHQKISRLAIFDLSGKMIRYEEDWYNQIDVSNMEAGMYLVQFNLENKIVRKKIFIY